MASTWRVAGMTGRFGSTTRKRAPRSAAGSTRESRRRSTDRLHYPGSVDVAWHPDGRQLASVSEKDRTVRIWDILQRAMSLPHLKRAVVTYPV